MAVQTGVQIQGDTLEAVRYQLETTGYWEGTVITAAFTNASTAVALIDGDTDLGTTFPVPPDSMVVATIQGAVYCDDADGDSDLGYGFNVTIAGHRIAAGSTTDVEGVGTALEVNEMAVELNTVDAASSNALTITAAADTTNQGIDVTFQNDSDDENCYVVGRMKLVCAKKGGLAKKYFTT